MTTTDTDIATTRNITKTRNRQAIIRHLAMHGNVTKRQLQLDLQLSLPTITGNIHALEHDGIIAPGPLTDSTGGRKSQSYRFNPSHRTAIGVTMHRNTLRLCAIDLQGRPIATLSRTLPYANTNAYYQRMGSAINDFAAETEKAHGPVLGVSFAIPGAISADGTVITFNDSTGATGVTIDTIAQSVRYPRQLIREAAAIAMTETLHDTAISDAICLYLNRRPSGALIMNGRLHRGPNLCDGAIEHMTLIPGGKPCHCGRRGCMAAYCSPENLPEDYESIPGFFSVLEQGETHHRERMNDWLDHVALAIANVRCVICADVVIGGEAALYLDHDNIADLQRRVTALSVFGTDHFTLRLSRSDENSGAIGAAMQFTDPYMDALCGWDTGPHPSSPAPTRTKIDTAGCMKHAIPQRYAIPHRYATRPGLYFTEDGGADVIVRSETADQVWLCIYEKVDQPTAFFNDAIRIFDDSATPFINEIHEHAVCTRIIEPMYVRETLFRMDGPNYGLWYVHLPKAWDGMRYAYRVDGAWDPSKGLRFNPYKLLLDPYGKGIDGRMKLSPAAFSYQCDVSEDGKVRGSAFGPMSTVDALGNMPVSVAIDDRDKTKHDADPSHPHVPWSKTVLYELHVKGFTANAPWLPKELRGTYAGLAHPTTLSYLQSLGVTSIELLPIQAKQDELFLQERGRHNYWGYSPLSYFSPEPSYATAEAQRKGARAIRDEVIGMVRALHEAGFEVIRDVVYNHTCEGGVEGPTTCWRGSGRALVLPASEGQYRAA